MNKYQEIGLYEHNEKSYDKIKEALKEDNIVAIVHATGTGKTYNALQYIYDNKDEKILFVTLYKSIIEHIEERVSEIKNINSSDLLKNVRFITYSYFNKILEEELKDLDYDTVIYDEFQHLGSPVQGMKATKMARMHPDRKVIGLTAYTVRDRGTFWERDMAKPGGDELFSDKVVSRYDLVDAMIDKVLPKPIYRTTYVNLLDDAKKLEEKIKNEEYTKEEKQEYNKLLDSALKKIYSAPGIDDLLVKNIKPNGKYIYFCPVTKQDGVNDIDTIMKHEKERLQRLFPSQKIELYKSISKDGSLAKENRKAFHDDKDLEGNDVKDSLRIMFCINTYNAGVHAPGVDGVIMGRETSSDMVFFEQLGRALSVRGNSVKAFTSFEKYDKDTLKSIAQARGIEIKDRMTKEDVIERLVAPVIIDLSGNIRFIRELETNLKERVKELQKKGPGNKRVIKLKDVNFDIEVDNVDLFEELSSLKEKMHKFTNPKFGRLYESLKKYDSISISQLNKLLEDLDNPQSYDTVYNILIIKTMKIIESTHSKINDKMDALGYVLENLADELNKLKSNSYEFKDWHYIYLKIRYFVKIYIESKGNDIKKYSDREIRMLKDLDKLEEVLTQRLGRKPTEEDLLNEFIIILKKKYGINNYFTDKLKYLKKLQSNLELLDIDDYNDEFVIDKDYSDHDWIAPKNDGHPENELHNKELKNDIIETFNNIGNISERNRRIFIELNGLDDGNPKSIKQLSDKYQMSAPRIRQINRDILYKLGHGTIWREDLPLYHYIPHKEKVNYNELKEKFILADSGPIDKYTYNLLSFELTQISNEAITSDICELFFKKYYLEGDENTWDDTKPYLSYEKLKLVNQLTNQIKEKFKSDLSVKASKRKI